MTYNTEDKKIESDRYNKRAKKMLESNGLLNIDKSNELFDRNTHGKYKAYHRKYIKSSSIVLEIGAGTGRLTKTLLESGAIVVATDISPSSLNVIEKRYSKYNNSLIAQLADMEQLPFKQNHFDIVSSAGSLSYGDNKIVMKEIYRVLKPGGLFICVDSLNDNPIYKFNRWIAYKMGKRTLSTIKNMPTLKSIKKYEFLFEKVHIHFFGSIIWLFPFFNLFLSKNNAVSFIEKIDYLIGTKKSAFKFVMVLRKK